MNSCPKCGTGNLDDRENCIICGSWMHAEGAVNPPLGLSLSLKETEAPTSPEEAPTKQP